MVEKEEKLFNDEDKSKSIRLDLPELKPVDKNKALLDSFFNNHFLKNKEQPEEKSRFKLDNNRINELIKKRLGEPKKQKKKDEALVNVKKYDEDELDFPELPALPELPKLYNVSNKTLIKKLYPKKKEVQQNNILNLNEVNKNEIREEIKKTQVLPKLEANQNKDEYHLEIKNEVSDTKKKIDQNSEIAYEGKIKELPVLDKIRVVKELPDKFTREINQNKIKKISKNKSVELSGIKIPKKIAEKFIDYSNYTSLVSDLIQLRINPVFNNIKTSSFESRNNHLQDLVFLEQEIENIQKDLEEIKKDMLLS